MKTFKTSLYLLTLSSMLLGSTFYPSRIDRRVNDWADLLSTGQEAQLEQALRHFERETSNQIVVATFPSLEGENLEDVSIHMFQTWQLGQAGRDNGILFTVFETDREMRIEVGYGLEGDLPDVLAARIIRELVSPWFQQGNYFYGLSEGLKAIMAATGGAYEGILPERSPQSQNSGGLFSLLLPLIIILMISRGRIGPLGGFMLGSMLGSSMRGRSYGSSFGGGGGFGGFSGGGGFGGGGGASGGW